jgi:translation initiation factor 4G
LSFFCFALQEEAPEEVAAPEEGEEGEITEEKQRQRDAEAEAKRRDREAAKAEVAARKRMLGNMIFVGQLYRFGVLTETVMHSCIKQLLEEVSAHHN